MAMGSCPFLKSVTTSCKILGHTAEAAKEARKKVYALSDYFGPHSIFFTITPDDECNFRVRMYANQGKEIVIPTVDCNEADCISDFELRQKRGRNIQVHVLLTIKLQCKWCVNC